jgi:YYY domain-containing protein
MFSRESLVNRYPWVGVIVWWLWIVITGWAFLPLARIGLRGLPDLGHSLAKIGGWLLVSWAAWILGSLRVPFVRLTIGLLWLALVVAGVLLVLRDRERWAAELRDHWRTWLVMEAVFLALFLFDLLIRYGNGDLWHPAFGGEKPMDFSYLNAVLRSTSFPPFDPWFAGGYINYYYYGFVILAIPIKLLGVIPSFAYNLSLPTLFALVGSAGFGLAWSLAVHLRREGRPNLSPWLAGTASAIGLVVLGNLGEVRLVWRAMVNASTLALPRGELFGLTNLIHGLWGGWRLLIGLTNMPYSTGDWYWLASRAIPVPLDAAGIPVEVEPITEFPFFTFLYGDPHAHMIAMPLTLLAMAAAIALVLRPRTVARWREFLPLVFVGSLAAGALRPTNTWDFPAQLGLIVLAIGYANWQSWREAGVNGSGVRTVLRALGQMALAVILAFVLFQPYSQWYMQGYTALEVWHGSKTPLDSYLIVHGLCLFVLVSFMAWQTREWMARRLAAGRERPGFWFWPCLSAGLRLRRR